MYERPQLKRYGSLRELTEAGWDGTSDGFFLQIASNGDNILPCGTRITGSCS